jgi:GH15 family glucan-1,4-alpha-glucosidase
MRYQPIANYGIIGDLHSAALVGMDGSIDFMCFPRFDSPTIFGALLDARKGGRFKLAPTMEGVCATQRYLPDSAILLTRFVASAGVPHGVQSAFQLRPVTPSSGATRRPRVVHQ